MFVRNWFNDFRAFWMLAVLGVLVAGYYLLDWGFAHH